MPIDQLVFELWGTGASERAPSNLRVHVSRLRKALGAGGEDPLETRAGGYVLNVAEDALDAHRFRVLAGDGRSCLARGEPQTASDLLHEALALWRGAALADIAGPISVHAAATELDDSRLGALEDRIEADLACGRHSTLAGELEALTSHHPLRERLWSERIVALYRCGRQAEALRAYQSLRQRLGDELGIEPSPSLRALEGRVLTQDPSLDWQRVRPAVPRGGTTTSATVAAIRLKITPVVSAQLGALCRAQFEVLLRDAVAAEGGSVAPRTDSSDEWVAILGDPKEGVLAALSVERSVSAHRWPEACDVETRIGLAYGVVATPAASPSGRAVERALELCSRAAANQVLCDQAIADGLEACGTDGPDGFEVESVTGDEGRTTFVIAPRSRSRQPSANAAFGDADLPLGLRGGRSSPLVGRDDELSQLAHSWEVASSGTPQVALVAGDAGIGKTSLVREFALHAHRHGATVLVGRCDEEILMPYQLFAEALRGYLLACPHRSLLPEIDRRAPDLARLVPSLRPVGEAPALGADADGERYRLFEAVSSLVGMASHVAPILLVLEDLHAADAGSILLLRHLLRSLGPAAVMVLATYRDVEVEAGHPLAGALAEFRRAHQGRRVHLGGLQASGVEQMLAARFGTAASPERSALADRLWRQTEGNPFFVREVIQHLVEAGALDDADGHWRADLANDEFGIPEGVKDVIGRRLYRLSPECKEVLAVASVVGRQFSYEVIEGVVALTDDKILDALDEAAQAHLISEVPRTVGQYTFTHTLIRETLYDSLSLLRSIRTHRKVGEAIERIGPAHKDGHVAALAHHFLRSAEGGDLEKALKYVVAAAEESLGQLAYEEAAALYDRAVELIQAAPAGPERDRQRAELLLGLGDAKRRAGDTAGSRNAFWTVADLGRSLDDPTLLAKAALGAGLGAGGVTRASLAEHGLIDLFEEALDRLGPEPSALRVRLMSRLSEELHFTSSFQRRFDLAEAAVKEAERLGDPEVILQARYSQQYCLIGPDGDPSARVPGLGAVLTLARELGDREIAYQAHLLRELALLSAGDMAGSMADLEEASALADELRIPALRAWVSASRSRREWMAGNFDEAGRLNQMAMDQALSQGGDPTLPMLIIGGQAMSQQILRADLHDFIEPLRQYVAEYPDQTSIPCFLAYACATVGEHDEAAEVLDRLARNDFAEITRGDAWLPAMWALARCVALLGDEERARVLYGLLVPCRHAWLADFANVSLGAIATQLGILATTFRSFDDAERQFARALELSAQLPSPPWLADAQYQFAGMLLERDAPGDRQWATKLLDEARIAADELAMGSLEAAIKELSARL